MPRKPNLSGSKRSTMLSVDLNSAKMKKELYNLAKNKHSSLTDFVRRLVYDLLQNTPADMKINRHSDELEMD